MSAPAKQRQALQPIEANRLVLTLQLATDLWSWRLESARRSVVAQGPSMETMELLWTHLCGIFDLTGTPAYYASRAARQTLKWVDAGGGRLLDIEYKEGP